MRVSGVVPLSAPASHVSAGETITRACAGCGVLFEQPDDPGRKRQYHDDACKQRVYRARRGVTGHEARDRAKLLAEAERLRAERAAQDKRDQDAARARARRARDRARTQASGPAWTHPQPGDTVSAARSRMRAAKLCERASHPATPPFESAACLERAETIRRKHNW